MKKFLIFILTFGITLPSFAGDNNNPEKKDKDKPSTVVTPMKIRNREARPDIPGSFVIDFGFNALQSSPESLETGMIGSRTVNLYYYRDIAIGNSNFVLMPGIGVGLDRYKFDENITLTQSADANGDNMVSITDLNTALPDADFKKSHLITNYIDIPLEVRYYVNADDKKRSFNIGVGGKAGILFGAHTKLKYDLNDEANKIKEKKEYGLNRFRYGLTGRIGIGGFNFFYYHSLSTMFDDGPAGTEDTSNITVGISVTGF